MSSNCGGRRCGVEAGPAEPRADASPAGRLQPPAAAAVPQPPAAPHQHGLPAGAARDSLDRKLRYQMLLCRACPNQHGLELLVVDNEYGSCACIQLSPRVSICLYLFAQSNAPPGCTSSNIPCWILGQRCMLRCILHLYPNDLFDVTPDLTLEIIFSVLDHFCVVALPCEIRILRARGRQPRKPPCNRQARGRRTRPASALLQLTAPT